METTNTKQESIDVMNAVITNAGFEAWSERDLIDYNLKGSEKISDLEEWARDIVNEEHTQRCATKNAWRYKH